MNNTEILSNLRTLGLDAGATADDIHAAFRKLARELHPDITGSRSDYRFKQVTSAYTFLKNITPEELDALNSQPIRNKDIFDYYSDRKKYKINDEKINAIIDKYEAELKSFYPGRAGLENFDMDALILRLKSENPKVINAALKHAGNLVNRVEFRRAFAAVLNKKEIDEGLAEIINSLPFEDSAKKLIALDEPLDCHVEIPSAIGRLRVHRKPPAVSRIRLGQAAADGVPHVRHRQGAHA